jgi:hypothetical protein
MSAIHTHDMYFLSIFVRRMNIYATLMRTPLILILFRIF